MVEYWVSLKNLFFLYPTSCLNYFLDRLGEVVSFVAKIPVKVMPCTVEFWFVSTTAV